MRWNQCNGDFECRRVLSPPVSSATIKISARVGRLGINRKADVLVIQRSLNAVTAKAGGATPALAEDGIFGPLSLAAILRFQKVQFPQWQPDGDIDPGKWSILRLNQLLGQIDPLLSGAAGAFGTTLSAQAQDTLWPNPELLLRAQKIAPTARKLVNRAIQRLAVVRATYAIPGGLFPDGKIKREADWHFKFNKAAKPLANIDAVTTVYQRMNAALTKYIDGSFPLFQLSDQPRTDAIAYAFLGGYSMLIDERPDNNDQGAYIYISSNRFKSESVMIHELGHYCGGRPGSGKEIIHVSSPHPKPNGIAKEDGIHNYLHLTPAEALRNVYSYQAYAIPDLGYGPPAG